MSSATNTFSILAISVTLLANGPTVSKETERGNTPSLLIKPCVGFIPNKPHADAGSLIEPPVSVPNAAGTKPAATTAADPDDEPPQT